MRHLWRVWERFLGPRRKHWDALFLCIRVSPLSPRLLQVLPQKIWTSLILWEAMRPVRSYASLESVTSTIEISFLDIPRAAGSTTVRVSGIIHCSTDFQASECVTSANDHDSSLLSQTSVFSLVLALHSLHDRLCESHSTHESNHAASTTCSATSVLLLLHFRMQPFSIDDRLSNSAPHLTHPNMIR